MLDSCPLIDKKGKPLKLNSIKYIHLSQLQNEQIEEGYTVEYKSLWDKKFIESKLCQTIASFANSSGGWLFVGINNDGSICDILKQKYDFSQQIGNILAAHVSPIPTFECRFIRNSNHESSGVLTIHIFEGANPPYVSKGTIYVRNGSNKTPINANRSDIDNLFYKSSKFKGNLNEVLETTMSVLAPQSPYSIIALCNFAAIEDRFSFDDIERLEKKVRGAGTFLSVIRTAESIVFLNSDVIGPKNCTNYIELFYNKSMRLVFYFPCLPKKFRDEVKEHLLYNQKSIDISNFVLIDLCALISQMNAMIDGATLILEEIKQDIRLYTFQGEFRNTTDILAYYEPFDEFNKYVSSHGLIYSLKDKQRTLVDTGRCFKSKDRYSYLRAIVYKYFANALGFNPMDFSKLYCDLIDINALAFNVGQKSYRFDYDR